MLNNLINGIIYPLTVIFGIATFLIFIIDIDDIHSWVVHNMSKKGRNIIYIICVSLLTMLISLGYAFFIFFGSMVLMIKLDKGIYGSSVKVSQIEGVSQVHVVIAIFFIIFSFLISLGIGTCLINVYKQHKEIFSHRDCINDILKFLSKILFQMISLFSIIYGILGNTLKSCTNGIFIICILCVIIVGYFVLASYSFIQSLLTKYVKSSNY